MKKSIKSTIKKLNKLGYDADYDYINCNNSAYLKILKNDEILFIIRLSDHDLRPGNYLPAGVINDSFYLITKPIPIRFLRWDIEEYLNMSSKEREYLWTNRLLINDPEINGLTIIEPLN